MQRDGFVVRSRRLHYNVTDKTIEKDAREFERELLADIGRGASVHFFDQRLGFDDGVFFGEGVKAIDEDALGPRFERDQAKGRDGQAMIGLEVVEQSAFGAVGENLVVNMHKNFRRQRLHLKARLVDDAVAQAKRGGVFAAQAVVQQTA